MTYDSPFILRYLWPCNLDEVFLTYDPALDFSVPGEFNNAAIDAWEKTNALRKNQGLGPLEPNPLYRPGKFGINQNRLLISAGITTYFDNFFLEKTSAGRSLGILSGGGISIVPVCKDGEILIGKRSAQVASHAGFFHVAGGHAHPSGTFREKPDTFHHWVEEELFEEMEIGQTDIERLTFLGMAVNVITSKPEWLIRAYLKGTWKFYQNRWEENRQENSEFTSLSTLHTELIAHAGDPPAFLLERLKDLSHDFTPACQAALTAHFLCS